MKLLAFSDWRVQSEQQLNTAIKKIKPDALIYAGDDLTRFVELNDTILLRTKNHTILFDYPDLKPKNKSDNKLFTKAFREYLEEIKFSEPDINLSKIKKPLYLVNGNDDEIFLYNNTYYIALNVSYLSFGPFIQETRKGNITIRNVEAKRGDDTAQNFGFYAPIKLNFGAFNINHKNESISVLGLKCESGLDVEIERLPNKYADIYLSHLPPHGCLDLSVRFGIRHIGSKKLRKAAQRHKPKIIICGHSHLWGGQIAQIDKTFVLNVSSHDNQGAIPNFAVIDTKDWSIELSKKQNSRTYIRGLRSIRLEMKKKLPPWNNNLYDDFDKYTYPELKPIKLIKLLKSIEEQGINTFTVVQRLKSLRWKKPKVLRQITINPKNHAFIDVETGLLRGSTAGSLWLIGIYYKGKINHFFIPKDKSNFIEFITKKRIKNLVSWTLYDQRALDELEDKTLEKIQFIDACARTARCLIWHDYSLHNLYKALLPDSTPVTKTDNNLDEISGYLAGLYADHLIIPSKKCSWCPSKNDIIDSIIKKNVRDLNEMVEICTYLWNQAK